jgi:TPP-dependent pyruvate/acetoin dehydrogenase alpha subunit
MPHRKIAVAGVLEYLAILDAAGRVDRALEPKIPREDLLRLYRRFLLVRRFDERMVALQRQGRIGTYLPVRGNEAGVSTP